MKITVNLTKDDFAAFWKAATIRIYKSGNLYTKIFILNIVYWAFLGFAGITIFHFYQTTNARDLTHLNYALTALVIWFVFTLGVQYWERKKTVSCAVAEDGTTLGRKEYIVDENGIREENDREQTKYEWDAIVAFDENAEYIFIYNDVAKGMFIPKRGLAAGENEQLSAILAEKVRTRI